MSSLDGHLYLAVGSKGTILDNKFSLGVHVAHFNHIFNPLIPYSISLFFSLLIKHTNPNLWNKQVLLLNIGRLIWSKKDSFFSFQTFFSFWLNMAVGSSGKPNCCEAWIGYICNILMTDEQANLMLILTHLWFLDVSFTPIWNHNKNKHIKHSFSQLSSFLCI